MFLTWKNTTETYRMLPTAFRPYCMNCASVFEWHKRFKGGRESVRDDEWYGRSKDVNTREFIGQKGYYVEVLRDFRKRFDRKMPVAFLPGQCTCQQIHPCHRLFDHDGHQDSSCASL